jgi:hypothetical protein
MVIFNTGKIVNVNDQKSRHLKAGLFPVLPHFLGLGFDLLCFLSQSLCFLSFLCVEDLAFDFELPNPSVPLLPLFLRVEGLAVACPSEVPS